MKDVANSMSWFFKVDSWAFMWSIYDPSTSEVTMKDMGKIDYYMN